MSFLSAPIGFMAPENLAVVNISTIAAGVDNPFRDTDSDGSPWTFDATLTFANDGSLNYIRTIGSNGSIASQWLISAPDTVNAALYEIACTETSQSGTATRTGDTSGSYFSLGTSRSWEIGSNTSGSKDWVLAFTIRDIATQTVAGTATFTLECEDGFT